MPAPTFPKLARDLLTLRASGGYTPGVYLRGTAWRYVFLVAYVGVSVPLLVRFGLVPLAYLILGAFFGVVLRDIGWVRATNRSWPFMSSVIDWERVEAMAGNGARGGPGPGENRGP